MATNNHMYVAIGLAYARNSIDSDGSQNVNLSQFTYMQIIIVVKIDCNRMKNITKRLKFVVVILAGWRIQSA